MNGTQTALDRRFIDQDQHGDLDGYEALVDGTQ